MEPAEPVARERVGAALQHERAGAVEVHHLLHHRLEQPLVRVVVHPVAQRHVDRVVLARPDADVLDVAGAGEEEVAVLVKGDGHHAVRREEGLLDAVAVVDVDVQVEHASVHLEQLQDREHDVVDVAEAGRLGSLRVMQPARPVDRDVGSASVEAHRAVDRASRVQAAVVVQAVKDGAVVADGEALQLLREVGLVVRRHSPQKVDVLRGVELEHLLVGGEVRPAHLHLPVEVVREDEVMRHRQPVRLHRMARAVVVGAHRVGIVEIRHLPL